MDRSAQVGMAAKNWSPTSTNCGVEELLFQNDAVSLCLLVNRRHRTLRVIDFRAGPTAAKRNFVIATAQRELTELARATHRSLGKRLGQARTVGRASSKYTTEPARQQAPLASRTDWRC